MSAPRSETQDYSFYILRVSGITTKAEHVKTLKALRFSRLFGVCGQELKKGKDPAPTSLLWMKVGYRILWDEAVCQNRVYVESIIS